MKRTRGLIPSGCHIYSRPKFHRPVYILDVDGKIFDTKHDHRSLMNLVLKRGHPVRNFFAEKS